MPETTTIDRHDADRPLDAEAVTSIVSLTGRAERADGGAPLSEQFALSVSTDAAPDTVPGVTHLLARRDGEVVGYAQVRSGSGGDPPSAELVVAPEARRQGIGSALLAALPVDARVWSHAVGAAADGAAAFAAAHGLVAVRSLHVMGRSLVAGEPWPEAAVPPRYAVRTFEVGRDEDAWLAVNAAAFAHHPEQGSLRRPDLEQRMAQPWFDPNGLLLIVERDHPDRIAASHWTKVDPPSGDTGEVYVVGVSPEHQGEGLGRAVTVLGLDHLRGLGLVDVVLYVDEENVAAVHTYTRLGFTDIEVHRQFARSTRASAP